MLSSIGYHMTSKRYNSFSEELKRRFGCRVHRISVDAGFTCPNRDGTVGMAGCIYCGGHGSGSAGIARNLPVSDQIEQGKEVMRRKYKARKFIAYFQPYSNTYAPVETLRSLYDQSLAIPDMVGLMVGTRPDCLPPEVADLLAEYHQRTYFWLELGLQSPHDRTLQLIGRGHSTSAFIKAVKLGKERNLRVCAHLILGLPGENREDMLAGAALLNELGVEGVKLHLLHVMEGTPLAEMYREGRVRLMDRDEYAGIICDFLERLSPDMLIHRLTGDGIRDQLIGPLWSLQKFEVLNLIDAEMERRGSAQGSKFSS